MSEFEITRQDGDRRTMERNSTASARPGTSPARIILLAALFCGLFLAGCGGGASSSTSSAASASNTVQTYQGVSNVTPALVNAYADPPFWTFVLGEAESNFHYDNPYVLFEAATGVYVYGVTSGAYTSDNDYLSLTAPDQSTAALGYALTIPGEAALLRPGSDTLPPVITADMSSCPVLKSSETFLFVALPGIYWNASTSAAYGSIQASTDSTGAAWTFSSQSQSLLAGSGSPPSYPASFTGTCGQGVDGYSIGVLPTSTWPYYDPLISVSPSGFFTEAATGSPVTSASAVNPDEVQQPLVGVVAPSSALDATSFAAGKYLGFMYESLAGTPNAPPTATLLVSFGSVVAGSGTTMTGGVFPNDDPSQTPAANITVNFGTQSSTQNGLYTGVTVTIPDATEIHTGVNNCTNNGGTSGTGSNGSQTCSFPAVAIAGNPTGKFAIFLIGQDPTQSDAPFGLYLYQQ